jgi:peptidylprolyl isomerase
MNLVKPEIEFPDFPVPNDLVIEDLTVGTGDEATASSKVTVHYVGVAYSTGEEFDSSWARNEPITFGLNQVGGRRKLVIPPHLGYGDRGAGAAIKPGETLIFVVDLIRI